MYNRLQYALYDNMLIHIDDVQRGLDCGCICPSCGSKLIARKGSKKIHHFAHYNSEECNNCIETSIHMLAKEILSEEMRIKIPAVYLSFSPESYKDEQLIYDEQLVKFDKVYLEKRIDDIIPDVVLELNGSKLLVEIYVTHGVDEQKENKIKEIGISTLLIDLSNQDYEISKEYLKEILLNDTDNKKWIYNKKEREIYNRFKEKARPFQDAGNLNGVFCPQYLHGWKGKSSARLEDCIYCEYCFSISGEVNCLGYSGVSSIKDLDRPELADISIKLKRENKIEKRWYEGTQCKKCRQGYMLVRSGKTGDFLGCSNYPKCNHTISI